MNTHVHIHMNMHACIHACMYSLSSTHIHAYSPKYALKVHACISTCMCMYADASENACSVCL
jgi:hypothetical protein